MTAAKTEVDPEGLSANLDSVLASGRPLAAKIERRFYREMLYEGAAISIISIVGCRLTSIKVPDAGPMAIGFVLVFAMILPLVLYLNEKKKAYLLDAVLTILWAPFLYILLRYPVAIAARLGKGIELQDANFAHLDRLVGVSVPALMAWSSRHWLGVMANKSYNILPPLLVLSILLPVVAGKVKHAQQFLTANLAAFALGLPLFALLPAVGPWYGYHLPVEPAFAACQAALLEIRKPGQYLFQSAGIVCFPSFHAIWAILCAQALWGIRPLRIPVAVLSGMIVFSTMSTGWHYFCDVLAGAVVAALAIVIAKVVSGDSRLSPQFGRRSP